MSLITNISQIRSASTITLSNTLDIWQPYLEEAEETFLLPVFGQEFLDILSEAANGSASGSSKYDDLLYKVRKALALYALYLGTDEMAVHVTSSGVQVAIGENFKPAPAYQIMNLKESFISRAHRHIDLALKYLEIKKEVFSEFTFVEHDCFIRNAADFQQFVDIHASRRVFISLLPVMKSIEKKWILPTISQEYFADLKSKIGISAEPGPSADDTIILEMIKPAVAHLTMSRALNEISIDLLDWGVFNTATNSFNSVSGKQQANDLRIAAMVAACERDGTAELRILQEFLDKSASASKYALYYASSRYVGEETAEKRGEFVNSATKSMFMA